MPQRPAHKVQQQSIYLNYSKLDLEASSGKNVLMVGRARQWNKLTKEVAESTSRDAFEKILHRQDEIGIVNPAFMQWLELY